MAFLGKTDANLTPTYHQIVECERLILEYFQWDLTFLLPIHFVRLHLANGVLFSNELKFTNEHLTTSNLYNLKQELTKALTAEALSLCDLLISKGACFLRKEQPSDVAASIIYFARKNILFAEEAKEFITVSTVWPEELVIMTRCTE